MIAVHANEPERTVVAEFFELFKTPWEFFHEGSQAEVVICSRTKIPETNARLVLIYGGEPNPFDVEKGIHPAAQNLNTMLLYGRDKIPIYGSCLGFGHDADAALKSEISGESAM